MTIKPLGPKPLNALQGTQSPAAAPVSDTSPQPQADGFDTSWPGAGVLNPPAPSEADLARSEQALTQGAKDAAQVFPEVMQAGVKDALEVSVRRIRSALAAGQINASEASSAMEMIRELYEGLADLRAGRATITVKPNNNEGVRVWRMRSPDGDEFQVTARRRLDEFGEARIGFRQAMDDGRTLPGRHRVSLRVDLERYGDTSVDMQYGGSSLDRRIHGLMKNPDGTVFETASGKNLADHHFRKVLPDHLDDPATFERLVDGFVQGTMAPFEAMP